MTTVEKDVERLLRWYPRRWREQHGASVLGMYLEFAVDGKDPLKGRAGSKERFALRAAGLFERSRFAVPISSAAAGTSAIIAGMLLAAAGEYGHAATFWLFVGPLLLSLALWGTLASRSGGWVRLQVVGLIGSAMALLALTSAFWVAVRRDQPDVPAPSVEAFWALVLFYAGFVGLATAAAITGAFERSGIRRDWAITATFSAGLCGAIALVFALLTGVGFIVVGVGLFWWAVRARRLHMATTRPSSSYAASS